jgi:phasin family protein
MYNAVEELAELNKSHVAQAGKVASLAVENAEKLARMNLVAAKAAVAQGVESAQAVAAIKEMPELLALRAKLAESSLRAAMIYSKDLYELATEAQAQYVALAEDAWAGYTKGVAAWVDKASRSVPVGSDVAMNAFKSTFAASTAAFDQFSKVTKGVVNLADAGVRAAATKATRNAGAAASGGAA